MISHLLEIRRRTLQVFVFFLIIFIVFFIFSADLFQALVWPLIRALPNNDSLIATQITSPVFTPLQIALNAALLTSAPLALFHCWRFVMPGLYPHENLSIRLIIGLSLILFASGVLFCFYWVLPFMLHFFAKALPENVRFMPDIGNAVDFITHMLLLFGLCFQVPLICLLLVRFNLIQITTLISIRPYIIVSAFIIGMMLTPPDVFSQIMLALPLCILYEVGIVLARFGTPLSIMHKS